MPPRFRLATGGVLKEFTKPFEVNSLSLNAFCMSLLDFASFYLFYRGTQRVNLEFQTFRCMNHAHKPFASYCYASPEAWEWIQMRLGIQKPHFTWFLGEGKFRGLWACHGPGRVTGQGVSRARACHGPGRVTDQGVSRTRVWSWFGPGLLSVPVLVLWLPFTTFYYLLLPFTTFYYLLPLFTTFYCLWLHLTFFTFYYLLLPFTAFYNFWIPFSTFYFLLLPSIEFYYLVLVFAAFYCLLLPFTTFLTLPLFIAFCCILPPGLVPVWYRFGPISRCGPGLVPVWSRPGRVTDQGVSRARACHRPGRVTDQGVLPT